MQPWCTHDAILLLSCLAAGAFHSCKPSDLMAELQGRLPIRVELKALSRADFVRILKEPEYNLIRQQKVGVTANSAEFFPSPHAAVCN